MSNFLGQTSTLVLAKQFSKGIRQIKNDHTARVLKERELWKDGGITVVF